ncbi:DUF2877 domain-containing protein [Vibrio sp. CAU 1672]|uniref:DUF2877 domain-containing protein n=1 Tax=Vibrio sp. CAU 1672 TaxID=3032594 RepID=UPI0023DB59DD|nr:DUF2877 domain-containing protein [Vibrio sp. CAU 1672]MDF2152985.1 DUF2877 domain-containing protein [Vibrio sp. CAU 1672]
MAYSLTAPAAVGPLRYAGCGSKAINFLTAGEEVLTLHLSGTGLGPSGWTISPRTFRHLSEIAPAAEHIWLERGAIRLDSVRLNRGKQGISLRIAKPEPLSLKALTRILRMQSKHTGLYGALAEITSTGDLSCFEYVRRQLICWESGGSPNWEGFLGTGPGLTPSHDDMLIGMLFCAYSDPAYQGRAHALLPESLTLSYWTTSVSEGYLAQARQGYFAEPLLKLNTQNPAAFTHYVQELMNHGHYSGADTLLGMWLFLKTVGNKTI